MNAVSTAEAASLKESLQSGSGRRFGARVGELKKLGDRLCSLYSMNAEKAAAEKVLADGNPRKEELIKRLLALLDNVTTSAVAGNPQQTQPQAPQQ